jgi:hypothetical protein
MLNVQCSMSHLFTTNKTKPVPNGKMARIMTHCHTRPSGNGERTNKREKLKVRLGRPPSKDYRNNGMTL